MKRDWMRCGVCLLACLWFLAGCASGATTPVRETAAKENEKNSMLVLTIGTADSGGTMYPVGKAIANAVDASDSTIAVNISASTGSSDNIRSLEDGSIDLGLVSGDVVYAAFHGTDEYQDNPCESLRVIAAVYSSLSNWLALQSGGLEWVHDLKGLRLGIGPENSATDLSAHTVLESLGIDEQNSSLTNCGLGSGTELLEAGTFDAVHGFAGIPISGFSEISERLPCVILKYTDKELVRMIQENPFYYLSFIPAGTYEGQTSDIPTFGVKCLLCVTADLDEELAYELTGVLYENREELGDLHSAMRDMAQGGFMCEDLPAPLHDGARRYYEEHGLLAAD